MPGERRLRPVLRHQYHSLLGRHARLLHNDWHLCAVHVERSVRRQHTRLQHGNPRLPRLRIRRRVPERDARLPGEWRLRAVLGDQRYEVRGRNSRLLHAHGDLRALHVQRPVRRRHARVQHVDAYVPRLRDRFRVRRRHACLSTWRLVRPVLGDQRHGLLGRDARLLHYHGHLRPLYVERELRRRDARLQHVDPRLSCLRRRL